jgi:hypothetical protein
MKLTKPTRARIGRLSQLGFVAVLVAAAQARDARVEVREGSRVYGVLSVNAAGNGLLLTYQGREGPFGECSEDVKGTATSPGGIVATVVERNCGATVDFATDVQLVAGKERSSVAVLAGRVPISLKWTGEQLTVTHPPVDEERVFRHAESAPGAVIRYAYAGPSPPRTQYLDFASFNYGATGRASGIPAELLLRAAGWSQQASGLYRSGWGTWDGAPPYGDDPDGSRQIRNGILYYEQSQKKTQQ